ncbi:MAG: DnaJ family molecular chaperone [Syntrophobacteraceae bacterium]
MSNCQSSGSSFQSRTLVKQDLSPKSDTVQFSREALDRLAILKQRRIDDPVEPIRNMHEEDNKLEKSLKMLETGSDAGVGEIRRAYLHAIKHYHPDKHAYLPPEFRRLAEVRSKQINELYNNLLRRKMGDQPTG